MANNNQIQLKSEITDLNNPIQAVDLANSLGNIVLKRGLSVNIQGKQYVMVEGWQLAGALCGIYPVVEKVENLSDEKVIRYRAEVILKNQAGEVVGSGMAICTNAEKGKDRFGEYAVCSMAQTRAVGKAMRLKLGWIIKLAGFQATPCEEMGEDGVIEENAEKVIDETDYVKKLNDSTTIAELYSVWLKVPKDMREELKELKEELKGKLQNEGA